jgi:hypothetical protein
MWAQGTMVGVSTREPTSAQSWRATSAFAPAGRDRQTHRVRPLVRELPPTRRRARTRASRPPARSCAEAASASANALEGEGRCTYQAQRLQRITRSARVPIATARACSRCWETVSMRNKATRTRDKVREKGASREQGGPAAEAAERPAAPLPQNSFCAS